MRLVPIVLGHITYYQVVDEEGYPLSQGSLETCERAMEVEAERSHTNDENTQVRD
jgi:hypothetical protein